jgi:uncharacterized membrane protein
MAFCPNCGAQVQGAFCMRCGSPVAGAPQQPQAPQQQPGGWQQQPPQYGQQPPQQPGGWQQQPPQYGQQPPQQPGGWQQQPPQYGQPAPAAAGMDENVVCALCYLLTVITGVVFLVIEPYNKNRTVRFHAFQAIFFGIGSFAVNIVMMIVTSILRGILNSSLWFIPTILSLGVSLGLFALWIFLMFKAYNKERFKLPVIGDLAEKQA